MHTHLHWLSLAVLSGSAGEDVKRFQVDHRFEVNVPADAKNVRAWLALPSDRDPLQEIQDLKWTVDAPQPAKVDLREVRDKEGNRFLYVEASQAAGLKLGIVTQFSLTRKEDRHVVDASKTRPLTDAELASMSAHLASTANVSVSPEVQKIAAEVIGGEKNPAVQARKLYDWVLNNVSYWVKHPDAMKASPVGSSEYCLTNKTGNCTDFHSLYTALARAAKLPTRMIYGSFLKGPLAGADKDQSYHCWVEFFAPGLGWIPIDVAVADVFVDDFQLSEANADLVKLTTADGYTGPDQKLVDYYFGNLDARRVTWHVGRDLVPDPAPASGPINALPKAVVEVDGKPLPEKTGWTRKLTFVEVE